MRKPSATIEVVLTLDLDEARKLHTALAQFPTDDPTDPIFRALDDALALVKVVPA